MARNSETGKEYQLNDSTSNSDHDDLMGYSIEDLSVGMTALFAKTVTEADIVLFAGISGDINPVHLNHEFATETMFEGRIAHGMLTASFISTVIGTKLPGPGAIYLKQSLNFKAPVRAGDTVRARASIKEVIAEKNRIVMDTVATVGDTVVLDGEALIMVPSRKA
jgi:3-hydroxybutyryl-CoA dehydratase